MGDKIYALHENVQEIKDRVVRLESRLVQLGDYVGANLREKQRVRVVRSGMGTAVEIDALDMSISRIYAEISRECSSARQDLPSTEVPVFCGGRHVLTLHPKS